MSLRKKHEHVFPPDGSEEWFKRVKCCEIKVSLYKTLFQCVWIFFCIAPSHILWCADIPAQVQRTCGGRRCELCHLCSMWPGAFHLGSTPCKRSEHSRNKKEKLRDDDGQAMSLHHYVKANISKCPNCQIWCFTLVFQDWITAWISVTHLVLVSGEELDLLSVLQVPQSDREIVGWRCQEAAGQRVERDGVNLLRVAYGGRGSQQLSINVTFTVVRQAPQSTICYREN